MRILLLSLLLVGCGSADRAALLRELRLDECEVGTVDIMGDISTSSNPLLGGNVTIAIHEERTLEMLPTHCSGTPQ